MKNKINIEKILKKHEYLSRVVTDGRVDEKGAIKAAIKEIVEVVIDKCAEEALVDGDEDGYTRYVNKESIRQVKQQIDYEL